MSSHSRVVEKLEAETLEIKHGSVAEHAYRQGWNDRARSLILWVDEFDDEPTGVFVRDAK